MYLSFHEINNNREIESIVIVRLVETSVTLKQICNLNFKRSIVLFLRLCIHFNYNIYIIHINLHIIMLISLVISSNLHAVIYGKISILLDTSYACSLRLTLYR